jgi:membrane protease YdiL (CAAX protease family)
MLIYFIASFAAYKLEGNVFTLSQFAHRYRLHRIRGREWFWFFALLITFAIALAGLGIWGDELSSLPALSMPAAFPAELDPSNPEGRVPGEFMGVELKSQWWIAVVYFLGWVLNIFGEEFWFRGFMLPRQEVAYGRWAWSLHGLVWTINHLFQVWTLVILFPYAFLWSYIIQRGKNTWIPIIAHGAANLIPLIVIIIGVIG